MCTNTVGTYPVIGLLFKGTIDCNTCEHKRDFTHRPTAQNVAIESERNVLYTPVLAFAMQSGFIKYCIILLYYYVILLSRTITIQNGALVSCVCANPQRLQ